MRVYKMKLRYKIIAAIAGVCALSAGTCETGSSSKDEPFPQPIVTTHKADTPKTPNPGAQPEPPAADPGPQTDAEHVVLKVAWLGERRGYVHVRINEVEQPAIHTDRPTKMGGFYSGAWSQAYLLSGVRIISFSWEPEAPGMPAQCSIQHLGTIVDHQGNSGGACAASWTRK